MGWRRGEGNMKFEWLQNKWDTGPSNSSTDELRETLQRLLSANEVLSGEAVVDHLVDEHATTIFARIANRMIELSEVLRDNITKDELIPAASLVLTVAVIIAGGYVMSYLVKIATGPHMSWMNWTCQNQTYMATNDPNLSKIIIVLDFVIVINGTEMNPTSPRYYD